MCGELCGRYVGIFEGGYRGTRPLPGMQPNAGRSGGTNWVAARATLFRGYIKSSSSARLTAARRLLTLSLL